MGVAAAILLVSAATGPRAHAFGGFWSSQSVPVKQTAERIVFVDNPDATVTAIVQLEYAGPPQKFAWVIPVPGKPKVGISSSTVFGRLDAATAPEYWVEVADGCARAPDAGSSAASSDAPYPAFGGAPAIAVPARSDAGAAPAGLYAASEPPDADVAPVIKVDEGSVGPYDYVNIAVDRRPGDGQRLVSDDPALVATDWLARNGYGLTGIESGVLGPYLMDGLHLLAFKLTSRLDAGAIRPVVLTYESKRPVIPLRAASGSASDSMGVRVWVFGPSQAVPANTRSLVLDDARIDWLSAGKYVAGTLPAGGVGPFGPFVRRPSNYDAVVAAAAREAGVQGFVTELGGPASQYRAKVWSPLDAKELPTVASQRYADGIDAIFAANRLFGGWDGWQDAIRGATTLPAGVTLDAFARDPGRYRGAARVDSARFFQLLREDVVKPVADAAAMFDRAPYLTRLYTTQSPDEMTVDPAFDYDMDLAQVSNVHIARQVMGCTPPDRRDRLDVPWRLKLPQGGAIAGKGNEWPVPSGAVPAALKIVDLTTSGPGTVIKDNSAEIGTSLFKTAGAAGSDIEMPRPPQNGAIIGGTQVVTGAGTRGVAAQGESTAPYESPPVGGARCSVACAGAIAGSPYACWLSVACALVLWRRRHTARPVAEKVAGP